MLYHWSCSYLPASHCRHSGSIPRQSIWTFWGQNCYGTVFLQVHQFFPVTVIPPVLYNHTSFIYHQQYTILATDSTCHHPLRCWISGFWLPKQVAIKLPKPASKMLLEECLHASYDGPTALQNQRQTHTILREMSSGLWRVYISSYVLQADIVCVYKRLMCTEH
jgi:hypothetical protein